MSRILVVDDDVEIQALLQETLGNVGYDVKVAQNGKAAMQCYQDSDIDLVIMDLFMPQKEGLRAIVALQMYDPDIKMIVMSGSGRLGKTDLLALMKDFDVPYAFKKPFRMLDMIRAVQSMLTKPDSMTQSCGLYQALR